jgi:hypothetical protein
LLATCRQIEQRLKQARSFLRRSSMAGSRRDQNILRQDLSNAGKFIVGKTATIAARLLKSDKLSPRQTSQSRLLEFSRGTPRLQLAAIDAVAKHLGHDFISAKKVDLKTMRLFLGARFCIDAANVRLRIGIRTSSHESKLTEQFQQSTRQTRGPRLRRRAKRVRRRQVPGAPFLIVFVRWQ